MKIGAVRPNDWWATLPGTMMQAFRFTARISLSSLQMRAWWRSSSQHYYNTANNERRRRMQQQKQSIHRTMTSSAVDIIIININTSIIVINILYYISD
jgi:hypothetical protein